MPGSWPTPLAASPAAVPLPRTALVHNASVFHPEVKSTDFELPLPRYAPAGDSPDLGAMALVSAGVLCLLHRWSGQTDLVLGVSWPESGTWLPLRCAVDGQRCFDALVAELGAALTVARTQASELSPLAISGASGSFNVALAFDRGPVLDTRSLPAPADVQLDFRVRLGAGRVCGLVRSTAATLGERGLQSIAQQLECVVVAAARSPATPLERLPWLSESERRRMLYEWNQTDQWFPADATMQGLLAQQAAASPLATAVLCEAGRLTYAELDRRAGQLASYLGGLGIGPGDRIALAIDRSIELVVGVVAALKLGAVYVPIDPTHPPERNAYILADARPRAVLTRTRECERLGLMPQPTLCLDRDWPEITRLERDIPVCPVGPMDPVVMFYTSGSTGQPKATLLHGRGFINLLHWFVQCTAMGPDGRVLLMTPITFDPSFKSILGPLIAGGALVLAPVGPFDPERLLETIVRHEVTATFSTPSLLYSLLDWARATDFRGLAGLRQLFFGGEGTDPKRLRPWVESPNFHCTLYHNYGPCECSDVSTTFTPSVAQLLAYDLLPLGRPLPNVRTYVLDALLQPVPLGVIGELYIGGVGVGLGYPNRPELTAERFMANPFVPGDTLYRTGDLVRWLDSGDLLFEGRADTQVKIRGMRVELGEIEAALCSHATVKDAVVDAWGRTEDSQLVAYLVGQGMTAPNPQTLAAHLRSRLPAYMIPERFIMLSELPLSPNGKVDRAKLRASNATPSSREAPSRGAGDALEDILASAWREILRLDTEHLAHDADFFELGGSSLAAARLCLALTERLGRRIPIWQLIEAPTLNLLADALRSGTASEGEP